MTAPTTGPFARRLPPPAFGDLMGEATARSAAAGRAWRRFSELELEARRLAQAYLDPSANGRPTSPPPSLAQVAAAFRRAAAAEEAHAAACARARWEA